MSSILNASASGGLVSQGDASATLELQSNGTTKFTVSPTGAYGALLRSTPVTASGTSVDFTGIPAWAKRITVMFNGVSTNGTSPILIQLGSGSFTTSGYLGSAGGQTTGVSTTSFTAGCGLTSAPGSAATNTYYGDLVATNVSGNIWTMRAVTALGNMAQANYGCSGVSLGGALDRIRITTVNGTDTFDAGSVNILIEG